MLIKFLKTPGLLLLFMIFAGTAFSQEKTKKTNDADSSIVEELKETNVDNIPVISLDEGDGQDGSAQNISSLLNAGRDPFLNAAAFKFGAVRFRIRGYDADNFTTYMNGVPMENLDNGFTPYGLWGGLNDVTRNKDNSLGLRPTTYAYGDIGGLNYLDTRASYQRKQTSINYAVSNRNYNNRIMFTRSTGLNKKGWAFSFSGSRRWADEGYNDGTFYDGWSFFVGVDKRINDKHLLSFVAFATPTTNGRQGASYEISREIAGTNYYNPYWGYQNGKKRNASVAKSFQPVGILTHDWKISDKTSLLTGTSLTIGKRSTTGLDWYNAADPRPDYYRYLPTYQDNPTLADIVKQNLMDDVNKRQIDWDRLYNVNYNSYDAIQNANGIQGNTVAGKRSHYIVENRVINTTKYNLNSTINTAITQNFNVTGGITFESQNNHYYKEVDDLLGGDFYVDVNQFAERDYPTNPNANQNDLNHPNRILGVGDKFGYNYDINIKRGSAWLQALVKFRRFDVFIATEHSYTAFYRMGNVKVGLFPDDSYGKSTTYKFYNSAIKGGITYKMNGRNYMFANASYLSKAPFFEDAFIAPRTRELVHNDLKSTEIGTVEAGYVMNAPRVKLRLTGYYTQFKNQLNVITFYSDLYQNFGNYAISNIGKEHMGIEFGTEAKIWKGISVNGAASIGRYHYNTRENVTITADNTSQIIEQNVTVFSKNYNVPTPQEAYTVGLEYRSKRYWFVNVSFNYFDHMYLDFDPVRRTESAVSGVEPGSELWHEIIDQVKLPSQYTLDAFAGWSWKMDKRFKSLKNTYLVFNVGVNNILDNKDIVSGGYEQLRFDFSEKNINKFADKRFYAYGLNYFASIGLRF